MPEQQQNRQLVLASAAFAVIAGCLIGIVKKRRNRHDDLPVYVLKNKKGMEVHITPVGAAIQRLMVPDQDNHLVDVVLGFDKPSQYMTSRPTLYFGAIVGRCANRIANAEFTLKGERFRLTNNDGQNALHGGPQGLHKRIFQGKLISGTFGDVVELRYESPDGEEGYPGRLLVVVKYELHRDMNELTTTITATTDKATPVNIVQHSYFNLRGHNQGTILDHVLELYGDHYTPVGDTRIPTGEVLPVANTALDFTTAHKIGDRLQDVPGGYDHNYVLFGLGPQAKYMVKNQMACQTPRLAAKVVEPESGRCLEVLTTAPGLQLYTGNFLDGSLKGKEGCRYGRHAGLCLETQNFPNAVNTKNFPSAILEPMMEYTHKVVYKFYNK